MNEVSGWNSLKRSHNSAAVSCSTSSASAGLGSNGRMYSNRVRRSARKSETKVLGALFSATGLPVGEGFGSSSGEVSAIGRADSDRKQYRLRINDSDLR